MMRLYTLIDDKVKGMECSVLYFRICIYEVFTVYINLFKCMK